MAIIHVDRGIPYLQALQKYNENSHNESGFFRSKREQYGKKLHLLAIQKERANHLFMVTRYVTNELVDTDIYMTISKPYVSHLNVQYWCYVW